jgi:hypothetical protein
MAKHRLINPEMARTDVSHAWLHFEKISRRQSQQPRGLAAKNELICRGKVGEETMNRIATDFQAGKGMNPSSKKTLTMDCEQQDNSR